MASPFSPCGRRWREPPDAKALGLKLGVAPCVMDAARVLRAVGLDDQPLLEADEIRDILPNRRLPAKLEPGKSAVAQNVPQSRLGLRRRLAHRPRIFNKLPAPHVPLPPGRERVARSAG